MASFILTRAAQADLAGIRTYYTKHADPETAERIIADIEAECARLAKMPGLGRARPEYDPEVRSLPRKRYVIFYFPRPFGVTIARVYDGSRDPDEVF